MKKIALFISIASFVTFAACTKPSDTGGSNPQDFKTLTSTVITDFVNKTGLPTYSALKDRATVLNASIISLNNTPTDDNLLAARQAWFDIRTVWEQSEGFLFGPVEDDNYDPDTDTWPVNFNDLDSLMNSANPLGENDIEALTQQSLKGYHPIEYILFGRGGSRTAASLTSRQKEYMMSLSQNLLSKATALYNSWLPTGGGYANQILTAGAGSTAFAKKQDLYNSIAGALTDICGEVGGGKMLEPYNTQDSNLVESPFSGNSVTDFKNNIIGAYNVYLGMNGGTGLKDLVRAKNISLDNTIQEKFLAAINSFDAITLPYQEAIINQRPQCLAAMNAINELSENIDTQLKPFILQNITN